jgi:hypothetical protein
MYRSCIAAVFVKWKSKISNAYRYLKYVKFITGEYIVGDR